MCCALTCVHSSSFSTGGVELQYRLLCKGCRLPVCYSSTPFDSTIKHLFVLDGATRAHRNYIRHGRIMRGEGNTFDVIADTNTKQTTTTPATTATTTASSPTPTADDHDDNTAPPPASTSTIAESCPTPITMDPTVDADSIHVPSSSSSSIPSSLAPPATLVPFPSFSLPAAVSPSAPLSSPVDVASPTALHIDLDPPNSLPTNQSDQHTNTHADINEAKANDDTANTSTTTAHAHQDTPSLSTEEHDL